MNLMAIYSTPIWQSEYPNFEEEKETLLAAVREFKEQNPIGEIKSNIAGYHSPGATHLTDLHPVFEYICQMAYKAVADLDFVDCDVALTEAWVNFNDTRQCFNTEHIHSDIFSGVFYLSTPEGSGKLNLINPGINSMWDGCELAAKKNQFTGQSIKIEPVEGNIIIFPSYLPHSVETNDHDEERIAISFNIIALPKGSIQQPQS